MKRTIWLCLALLALLSGFGTAQRDLDLTRYVDPFIGTGGHGHTFPGATVPFGMVQLSPDTRIDNWDGSSGYHYSDSVIFGFSHTHLSGTGIPDYCDVLFMPHLGTPQVFGKDAPKSENGYASRFSHSNEKAEPGYYRVMLDDDGILAELTTTRRVGVHRYTFPQSKEANIALDLKWRDKVLDAGLNVVSDTRVEGHRRSSSWAKDQAVYFVAEFSKPFKVARFAVGSEATEPVAVPAAKKGTDVRGVFTFETGQGEQILLKVGISAVSIEGARRNLEAEIEGWDFDTVRAKAKAAWNEELSQITVKGGTAAELTNFYTALYHTKIHPNTFQDVDGKYIGLDRKVRTAAKDSHYTVFSLWDTFRSTHPLYTITDRKRTVDFINTFIRMYEEGGRLPVWELAGNETDTMIGYHSVSVIADAMAKGISGFDYRKAFEAAKHSAELDHFGMDAYKRRGYISMEDEQESVSKTLEYAYNDFCMAVMAQVLIKEFPGISTYKVDYDGYIRRSRYYQNLFDKETGFMRPKQNGNWISPFAPGEVTFHFTEGNSWVYTFFVPHDVTGLMELYGGKEPFARKVESLFTTEDRLTGRVQPDITGLIGQYAHGNEPSHHIAYLFNYADEPWMTQRLVRRIMDDFYKPTPDGLIGNEDCGQMSAWYVLSALGFFQVNPGQPVYTFGTPLFDEASIRLENGRTFTMRADRPSAARPYISEVRLNGSRLKRSYFTNEELDSGALIEFRMSPAPVLDAFDEAPVSGSGGRFPSVPTVQGDRVFDESTTVTISVHEKDAEIRYTLDGSSPGFDSTLYKGPFRIDGTVAVRAVSVRGREKSMPVEAVLNRRPNDWDVSLASTYNRQYTGGGPRGLIDGLRGTTNFASGEWQGYQAQDFIAVIDLKRPTVVREVGAGFLQVARSWIWMPTRVEFEASLDGTTFTKVAEIVTDVGTEDMTHTIRDYIRSIEPRNTRYIRIYAYNLGKIPTWHPGAGFEAFIFVDEIFIR
jgi:predicted alpha-1,2-mannosidase